MASVAPDAAISLPPDAAAAVPGLAPAARAHPAANKSHRDAGPQPSNATITTDVGVLPASQESDISASSSASYAPALLSSQSNVSTESIIDTELTSPATSNVSSQCPPFSSSQPVPPPANQEDARPPPPSRAVTPQPAATTSEKLQNASSASPMAVDTPTTTISQGTKRTASGAVKLPSASASSTSLITTGLCSSVPSAAANIGALSSLSRIGKLSADLKTRLSYAMVKVQNGWEHQSIEELETAATSQRTSRSATQTPTSAKFRNATDSPHAHDRRRRPSALSDPSDRYLGTPGAQRSPSSGIRTFGPAGGDPIDEDDARPSTASTFSSSASSAPTLAPALDISPTKRHRRSTVPSYRAPPPPMLGATTTTTHPKVKITKPFTEGGPATPMPAGGKQQQQQQQRPVGILRMPSQQAEMDAVDSLLFMSSSPNNSAHLAHTTSASSTANPSPLKTEFPMAKRVAFDDDRSSSRSSSSSGETERPEKTTTTTSSGRVRVA